MKRILKSLGTAILYYILFLGIQLVVSFEFGIIVILNLILNRGAGIDYASIAAEAVSAIAGYATLISLISGILTLLVLFLIFGASLKRFASETGLAGLPPSSFALPLLLGITLYGAVTLIIGFLPIPEGLMDQYEASSELVLGGSMVINLLAVVLVAPIVEEVIFRGLILSRLRRAMPTAVAAFISSALFAIAHGAWVWMAYAFVTAMAFCFISVKYRSIAVSIAAHMVFNLFGVIMGSLGEFDLPGMFFALLLFAGLISSVFILIAIGRRKTCAAEASDAGESGGGEQEE